MGNTQSVTQLALKAIIDVESQQYDETTPEKILDYLQDDGNFKSLSDQLKETMIKAEWCKENDSLDVFINTLYKQLREQPTKRNEESLKKIVKRWLTGETEAIRNREDIIRIIFALELSLDQAIELLNKCGFSNLNVRNAEDATYMYCILNNRPLKTAQQLLKQYYEADDENVTVAEVPFYHSGYTTRILENSILGNSSWENDEDFFNSFLIPNKKKFVSYTASAVKEYYSLKNDMSAIAISNAVTSEKHEIGILCSDYPEEYKIIKPVSTATGTALFKHSNESSLLYPAYLELNNDLHNADKAIAKVSQLSYENPDFHFQKTISNFFDEIMTIEGVLKVLIPSIKDGSTSADGNIDESRIRRYKDSKLKNSVMKEFPRPNSFTDFEEDYSILNNNMTMRKAIILMCYLVYAYEFTSSIPDTSDTPNTIHVYNRFSEQENELGFLNFKEYLDTLLKDKCKMGPLYPGCQFDWLILRSIRQIEVFSNKPNDIDGEESIEFFNNVLWFSFGEKDFF